MSKNVKKTEIASEKKWELSYVVFPWIELKEEIKVRDAETNEKTEQNLRGNTSYWEITPSHKLLNSLAEQIRQTNVYAACRLN